VLHEEVMGGKNPSHANPFDFMDMISLEGKTNFFEKRVSRRFVDSTLQFPYLHCKPSF